MHAITVIFRYVRLALESIIGNNLNSIGRFDFHDLQEITGELNSGLKDLEMSVTTLLRERISSGKTILNSTVSVLLLSMIGISRFSFLRKLLVCLVLRYQDQRNRGGEVQMSGRF